MAALLVALIVAVWWFDGPTTAGLSHLVFGSALLLLFVVDVERHLLPNAITLPGILIGFAFGFFTAPGWTASLLGIVAGGGAMLGITAISRSMGRQDGVGMGDVKMLAMIGAFLGWKLTIVAFIMALVSGSLVAVALRVAGAAGRGSALPFGPFLAAGAAGAATIGSRVLQWYLGLWGGR